MQYGGAQLQHRLAKHTDGQVDQLQLIFAKPLRENLEQLKRKHAVILAVLTVCSQISSRKVCATLT